MSATHLGTATWTTAAGAKTVTATPAVNDLIVVVCANSGRTTAQAPTITDNNSSGTYTQVAARTRATSVDSVWVFIRNSLIASASSTIFTMTPVATDTGGGLDLFAVAGATRTGSLALRQTGGQDNIASGTPSVTMGSAILTANAVIGAVLTGTNGTANSAPPSGWATEPTDLGYLTPPTGLATEFRSTGETLTTVAFGAAAPSAFCSVMVEIDLSALPPAEGVPYVGGGYYP